MTNALRAEESVIGACLVDASAYWRAADVITDSDFTDNRCRALWGLIGDLCRANRPVDAVTLGDLFVARKTPNARDWLGYVIDLANSTPSATSIRSYAEIIASRTIERRVREAGKAISGLSGDSALTEAQGLLGAIVNRSGGKTQTAKSAMGDLVKIMEAQAERDGSLLGITTGLADLDAKTCGMCAGDLWLIAGRPSMGKSVLGLQLAYAAADAGAPAYVLTLEMATHQCLQRLISAQSNIPHNIVRDAKLMQEEHWPRVARVAEYIGALPLYFDAAVRDLPSIIARIRQLVAAHGIRIVVIDYLSQIITPRAERNDLAIQEITRELKAVAKALGITVVLLSQLNRGVEQRPDKRPVMSDLRESGAIEQDADVIMMPYRDEYYFPDSQHKGYAEIIIRKQRNGEIGTVPVRSELAYQRFADAPDGLPKIVTQTEERPARGFNKSNWRKAVGE